MSDTEIAHLKARIAQLEEALTEIRMRCNLGNTTGDEAKDRHADAEAVDDRGAELLDLWQDVRGTCEGVGLFVSENKGWPVWKAQS